MINILFNGPPGSGKDEACEFLKMNYGFKHLQIKEALFIETANHFGVSLEWFMSDYNDRKEKETPRNELRGLSKREALIYTSEEVIKPLHGNDYFGRKTAEKMDSVSSYCISDLGFFEEVIPVINTVGQDNVCIVQLYREGCSFSSDSRGYIYGKLEDRFGLRWYENPDFLLQTEPQVPVRMYEVYNNTSVSDFHQNIRKIIRREANVKPKISYLSGKSV